MLNSSNFVRLFHCQSFALYDIGNGDISADVVSTKQSENAASTSRMDTNKKENVIPLLVSWEDVRLAKEGLAACRTKLLKKYSRCPRFIKQQNGSKLV